jgi:uncharacterized protein (UPF0333 family)
MNITLNRNQSGIAHLMLILVIVVIAGVGGAGYYVWNQSKDKESGSSAQSASDKEVEAECKRTIEDKDLCKMASNSVFDKGNYVITITGSQDGQQLTWTIQNDGENSQLNMFGMETITYNGDSYMKEASGGWVKYPKSDSDAEASADSFTEDLDFSDEEASYYTKVGKEACGSLTCFHYSYKDPNDSANNAEFWFDDKEYKIRKVTSASTEDGSMEMLITYGNAKVSPPETFTSSSE